MATILIANPSADVYGADLQLLDSVSGLVAQGYAVVVSVPDHGPLEPMIRDRGGSVRHDRVPVTRRASLSARGVATLGGQNMVGAVRLARVLRAIRPAVVYVNTVTIPAWIAAARLARIPVLCHVHEAEDGDSKLALRGLLAPLTCATSIVANGKSAIDVLNSVYPRTGQRAQLIYNGVSQPTTAPHRSATGTKFRVVTVSRLSPRKAPEVAMEAIARLRADGRDVHLTVFGTAFKGYEWFERQLHNRANQSDLAGAVTFGGYVSPIWDALAECDAIVAPSLRESFGNAVVEAQLARRPVVATATTGHLETVVDGRTGLLVAPGDVRAMADALAKLMDDSDLAGRIADAGREQAIERFSVERYRQEIGAAVAAILR